MCNSRSSERENVSNRTGYNAEGRNRCPDRCPFARRSRRRYDLDRDERSSEKAPARRLTEIEKGREQKLIDAAALKHVDGQIDIETMRRIWTLLTDQSNADLKFFRRWLLKTGEYRQLIEIDGGRSHLIVRDEVS